METGMIERAVAFAARKHDGQYRESVSGDRIPYVVHPLRVAMAVARAGGDEHAVAAAICHDTLEDTDATYEELAAEIGSMAADVVVEVTDEKSLKGKARIDAQVAKAPRLSERAKLVKVKDKTDNVYSVVVSPPPWSPEVKRGYAASAERVVKALGFPPGEILDEFEANIRALRSSLGEAA